MTAEMIERKDTKMWVYAVKVKVDSKNQRNRQDVYYSTTGGHLNKLMQDKPYQIVISDYKYSTIMDVYTLKNDTKTMKCEISAFEESLNIISNLLSEMWIPREDSITYYLGE
jgi:hypothetical protein